MSVRRALFEITKVEFKLYSRLFIGMFFALVFPSMMLLIFGGIYGNKPEPLFGGYGTVDISTPAYSAMIIAVTGIMSLPLAICGYREKKILKRYMATPISPMYLLVSQIAVNFLMTIGGMGILIAVGILVFDLHFFGQALPMIFAFILSTLSIFAIGFTIASLAPGVKAVNAISNIIYFPMIFLTGATLPIEVMPETMRNISRFLPLTYAVDLLKGIWLGGKLSDYTQDIIILIAIFFVGVIISIFTFRWE